MSKQNKSAISDEGKSLEITFDDDIVKIGIWTVSQEQNSKVWTKALIAFLGLLVLFLKMTVTVMIYMYFWNTPTEIDPAKQSKLVLVIAQIIIYVLTANDIVDHT